MTNTLITVIAITLLVAGCDVAQSPVAPSLPQPVFPSPPPAVTQAGPHFALEIQPAAVATYDGDPWVGYVSVTMNPSIIRPEMPAHVVTTCGTTVTTHPLGSGSARFSCLLPVGTHGITARAQMADGRVYQVGLTVTILAPPASALSMTVEARTQGAPPVRVHHFSATDVNAYRYRWSFDDRTFDTTLVPNVTHAYTANGQYRADVTAVDRDGRTIGFGSVAVAVDHLD